MYLEGDFTKKIHFKKKPESVLLFEKTVQKEQQLGGKGIRNKKDGQKLEALMKNTKEFLLASQDDRQVLNENFKQGDDIYKVNIDHLVDKHDKKKSQIRIGSRKNSRFENDWNNLETNIEDKIIPRAFRKAKNS